MAPKFFFIIPALLFFCGSVESQSTGPQKDPSGNRLKNAVRATALAETEIAYGFGKNKIQKAEIIFKPELDIALRKNIRWLIRGRLYAELMDNLEPGRPNQEEVSPFSRRLLIGDRVEAELREFYFDIKIRKSYLTLGRQQIVWGKADGLRIMDLVNPFNFREFILDDFEDSRIPLWSLKWDIPIRNVNAQIVWIPDLSYHDFPDPGAAYSFQNPLPSEIIVRQKSLRKPDNALLDSDIGLKLSSFYKGWDISLNYLYFYDDSPVVATTLYQENDQTVMELQAAYIRTHLAGTTFSNAFGQFSVRGELGLLPDKYFQAAEPESLTGLIKSTQLMGVAGIDYSGLSNTTLSFQVFYDWIPTQRELLNRQSFETNFSLLLSRNFMNETLTTDLIAVQNAQRGEGFARGSIGYLLRSNLKIWAGAEIIYGSKNTLLGQFRNQDRIFTGMEIGI